MKKILVLGFVLFPVVASAQQLPTAACASLREERAKYPVSLSPYCSEAGQVECPLGKILNTAALKANLGMAAKSTGYWVTSPAGKIASDILMRLDKTGWDVFTDAENRAVVNCGNSIGKITNRSYVTPVETTPEPPPPTGTCEEKLKTCEAKVAGAKAVIVWP